MGREWEGEHVNKKLARIWTYWAARTLMMAMGVNPREATYLVLAGRRASEVGLLKYVMRARPENVWFVEKGGGVGLATARQKWPGCNTWQGDLAEAKLPRTIGFANLDWTNGLGTNEEQAAAQAVRSRLRPQGAVVAWTWMRCMDNPDLSPLSPVTRTALRLSQARFPYAQARDCIPSLAAAFIMDPRRAPGPPAVVPVWRLDYRTRRLKSRRKWSLGFPMSVSVMACGGAQRIDDAVLRIFKQDQDAGGIGQTSVGMNRAAKAIPAGDECEVRGQKEVCLLANLWAKHGLTPEQQAEVLDMPPGVLAAWKAHLAMGTYGGGRAA